MSARGIRIRVVIAALLLSGLGVLIGVTRTMNQASQPATGLGVQQGRLAACPDSPNCVSTQEIDASHAMTPIPWTGSVEDAMSRLVTVVESLPRTKIVTQSDDYLHVEFRSAIFRFVDDVEFWIDPQAQQIHFRSASRIGYSDLGANRKRMTKFVERFERSATP